MSNKPLNISWELLRKPDDIAAEWQQLESQAQCSVFVSWQWIGVWLQTWQPELMVLRVFMDDELVGLALFSSRFERRHSLIGSRVLRLHQTGIASQDQIWIEYNAVLAKRGLTEQVELAVLNFLLQLTSWDELMLAGITRQQAENWQQSSRLSARNDWQAPCFGVDLQALRQSQLGYLNSLSANCRYQINRSKRLYQQMGELRLEQPATTEQALQCFDDIAPWHIQRWGAAAGQSGFSNPAFVAFHHAMLSQYWQKQQVELLMLMAGDQHLATFYNLRYREHIYFYLAGFRPESNKQLKPGLVGHSLCIEHYNEQGLKYYDFMAGDERYKRQLGQQHSELCHLVLQKKRWCFQAEALARRAKHQLLKGMGAKLQP